MNTLDKAIYKILNNLEIPLSRNIEIQTFTKGRAVGIKTYISAHKEMIVKEINSIKYLYIHKTQEFRRFSRFTIKRNLNYKHYEFRQYVNKIK
tara:strand:- start:257 stop:535 length:279 start_codon:yes stop_codon:yes gene_type:complete